MDNFAIVQLDNSNESIPSYERIYEYSRGGDLLLFFFAAVSGATPREVRRGVAVVLDRDVPVGSAVAMTPLLD